jgi:glycosyltransferase involved in cell wall biosynthesis
MRIGIMAPPWAPVPPPAYGGTESVVDRLARGFIAAGHEVLLWCTGDSTCPVPSGHVFEQAQWDRMGEAVVELRHLIRGYEALEAWGADIVHDHTLLGPLYARNRPGIQVVTTNHGPFNGELFDLYRTIADTVPVIAISHDQASRARDVRITAVIHHGLDPEAFSVGDGRGDESGTYFFFLGRMAPDKGVDAAARAARAAGVRLLIAAKMREPNEKRFFHEQVEPLLDERITYVGEIGVAERMRLLGGARALINPIRWPEPFGLVMIEALACGTPVLALREGSAPELIDDGVTGFVCDTIEELTQRIDEVDHLDRAACRAVVEQRFSTRRMVADHLALFERILSDQHVEVDDE